MISMKGEGSFKDTEAYLKRISKENLFKALERYGQQGVTALASATPVDTSQTANQWSYEVLQDSTSYSIIWSNGNVVAGRPVAILLQYGHATGTGGYVEGRDYINPALRPIFDRIEAEVWKVVNS